jgi:predicted transcriptional regulator
MDFALKSSFTNIKKDISSHENSLASINTKLTEQEKLIRQLIAEIARIQNQNHEVISSAGYTHSNNDQKVFGERPVESTERSVTVLRTPNSLSALHLEILKRIMLLQMETGKRCITMREIASEVYPTKEYSRIKSTMSEYIKSLHRSGLVEKVQKEKLYLSYTEKALQYADEQRISRMKEIIATPIQTVR